MRRYSTNKRSPGRGSIKKRRISSTGTIQGTPAKWFTPSKTRRRSSTTWFTPPTSPSPKNVKHVRVDYLDPELGEYGMWVNGGVQKVHDRWTPGNRITRVIDYENGPDLLSEVMDARFSDKYHVMRVMIAQYKKGLFEPERGQHNQQAEWPMPKKTYDDALKLFYRAIGKTNVFNQTTAATEENPLATPYLAPDLTRTDYNARIARRQYLRQYKDDRAQVKRMQRMFEDSMDPDDASYFTKLRRRLRQYL